MKLISVVRYAAIAATSLAALTACDQGSAPVSVAPVVQQAPATPTPLAQPPQQQSAPSTDQPLGQVQIFQNPAPAPVTPPSNYKPAKTIELHAVSSSRIGTYVTDNTGRTLYRSTTDNTNPPQSNCNGRCAEVFPPMLVNGSAKIYLSGIDASQVGVVQRSDGTAQVTIGGSPVYYYFQDQPGQINGQGVSNTWSAVNPMGGSTATSTGQSSSNGLSSNGLSSNGESSNGESSNGESSNRESFNGQSGESSSGSGHSGESSRYRNDGQSSGDRSEGASITVAPNIGSSAYVAQSTGPSITVAQNIVEQPATSTNSR